MTNCCGKPDTAPTTTGLLAVMQFWEGDRAEAMAAARLMADMTTRGAEHDFMFAARFDATHDTDTVNYVARKFRRVYTHTAKRKAVGWPHGPNELWFDTMLHCATQFQLGKIPRPAGIFTLEGDDCPLRVDWLTRVEKEFVVTQPRVMGALVPYPKLHINGNAVFSPEHSFLEWLRRKVCAVSPTAGWDYVLASQFQKWGWRNTHQIRSIWGSATQSDSQMKAHVDADVALLHGVKDSSARNYARANCLRRA